MTDIQQETQPEVEKLSLTNFNELLGVTLGTLLETGQGKIVIYNDKFYAVANTGTQIVATAWNKELEDSLKDDAGEPLLASHGLNFKFQLPEAPEAQEPLINEPIAVADMSAN